MPLRRLRHSIGLLLLICLAAAVPGAGVTAARAQDARHWTQGWKFTSFAEPCAGDCAVTILGGTLVDTPMYHIFVDKGLLPWQWRTKDSYFVAGTLSREVVAYRDWWAIELEAGVGKRFGLLDEGEVWGAAYLRWKWFPWNDYLRTTIAISTGLNYATDVPPYERGRTNSDKSPRTLHYLSPEITFGLPSMPDLDLVLRFHHRSGGKANIFNSATGGVQHGTAGIRYRF